MSAGSLVFETERLRVREYLNADLAAIHDYAQHAEVVQYQNWGPNQWADTEEFLQKVMSWPSQNPRMSYGFCIASKETNQAMGGCGIYLNKEEPTEAKIGYIMNPKFWNRGYTTEVVLELGKYAQEELKLQRVLATCDVRNMASRRVLEKSGFMLIDTLVNHYKQKGIMRDSYLFKLADEKSS